MAQAMLSVLALAVLLVATSQEVLALKHQDMRKVVHALIRSNLAAESSAASTCASEFGGIKRHLIAVADPGGFTGSAEAKYYVANLKDAVKLPANDSVCGTKTTGTIMGVPVMVLTTGIGPVTAALCMIEVLKCIDYIINMVYSGTSGWSAQVGGVLNGEPKFNPSTKVIRLGDVCVTPFAINWDCQLSDWTGQCASYPNVNAYPELFADPTVTSLYGECVFNIGSEADLSIAKSVISAGRSSVAKSTRPARTALVKLNEYVYFNNMSVGTGVKYDYKDPNTPTGIYTYNQCAEVDGQFFYSGVPWEMSARNFTAVVINAAFGSSKTQKQVVAAAAEEGVGIAYAIEAFNALASTKKNLTYTFVRGMSDYLHNPVVKEKDGTWRQIDQTRDFNTGYGYAIASFSNVVLTWLKRLCIVANKKGVSCTFTINYS